MNGDSPQPTFSPQSPMKKACMITIMFPVEKDDMAMSVKRAIDEALPDVEGKRYTFQITER